MSTAMPPRLLNAADVARRLLVPVGTIRRWMAEGQMPIVRLPNGEQLIDEADLIRWLDTCRVEKAEDPYPQRKGAQ